jgi:spoIIIJ-associated protein
MKDQIFSGRTIGEALEAASRLLGRPPERLHYVVLAEGTPGALGMGGTPAQIAVLATDAGAPPPSPSPRTPPSQRTPSPEEDPRALIRRVLRALSDEAGISFDLEIEEKEDSLVVRITGPDSAFFLEEEGAVLRSLEHLLQRMLERSPRRLVLDCAGYRDLRDETLKESALQLARAVRKDGVPRTTPPLNSYERRIVHLALSEEADVCTFSVGEGSARRVTVALKTEGEDAGRR